MKKLVLAALLASAVSAPACAAELVHNGGFESASGVFTAWDRSLSPSLQPVVSGAASHSGLASLLYTANFAVSSDFISQTLSTVVGETYHYSYWLRGEFLSDESQSPASGFQATLGGASIGSFANSAAFAYVQVFGDFVATSTQTELTFSGWNKTGYYMLDDISVTSPSKVDVDVPGGAGGGAVPEPATWAMMLLGFFGIGAALRRRASAGQAFAA